VGATYHVNERSFVTSVEVDMGFQVEPLAGVVLRGGKVLDAATGESRPLDLGVSGGMVVEPSSLDRPSEVDASGLLISFGLWDNHAHPGSLMYDPSAGGFFESIAARTVRAGENLREAASMGITGMRCLHEVSGIDLAWAAAFKAGAPAGPRVLCAGQAIRTTGGHGTVFPRRYFEFEDALVADGPAEMARAVRSQVERGVDWIKVLLTGGLMSEHETVDGAQLSDEELVALVATATQRGLPVAAHCGGARPAERFAELGGRTIEHGYALDERAARRMADAGTWLDPTLGVSHDSAFISADDWPAYAAERAARVAPAHAESLRMCLEAGVRILTGADLNPIGPRLHAELAFLHKAGMSRREVLYAATVASRTLNGLGDATAPAPGVAADLLLLDGDPLEDLGVLREPAAVMAYGRFLFGL
jgi:imidazolonepropionase-like amidohydrolase